MATTKNIFDILSDHSDDEEGGQARGSRQRGTKTRNNETRGPASNYTAETGQEKVDKSHHKQPVKDDRHSRNGPPGNNKNALKKGGAGSLNVGTVQTDLKGAESYSAKELVAGEKGRSTEGAVVDNTLTLKEYYEKNGIRTSSEATETVAEVKIDIEALKKEKLTLVQKKSDFTEENKGKNKKKNVDVTQYKAGYNSGNADLLGVKSGWKFEEERPKRRDFEDRDNRRGGAGEEKKTEERAVKETKEETTTPATTTTTTTSTTDAPATTTDATEGGAEGGDGRRGNRRGNDQRRGGEGRGGEGRGEGRGGEGRGEGRGGDRRGGRGEGRGGEGRGGEGRGGDRGGDRQFNNDRRGGRGGDNNNRGAGGKQGGKKEFTGKINDNDFPDLE